jgi:hypothetical protein
MLIIFDLSSFLPYSSNIRLLPLQFLLLICNGVHYFLANHPILVCKKICVSRTYEKVSSWKMYIHIVCLLTSKYCTVSLRFILSGMGFMIQTLKEGFYFFMNTILNQCLKLFFFRNVNDFHIIEFKMDFHSLCYLLSKTPGFLQGPRCTRGTCYSCPVRILYFKFLILRN